VKAEIHSCDRFEGISQYACFVFATLGAISDVANVAFGLESISWFLPAIVAGLNTIIGHMHGGDGKAFTRIEAEFKQE
jgi:hypothetical protein